jgi:hypothetical protein
MAKRKIFWSNRAIKRLYGILEFYDQRNKSKTYSKKLYQLLNKQIKRAVSVNYLAACTLDKFRN